MDGRRKSTLGRAVAALALLACAALYDAEPWSVHLRDLSLAVRKATTGGLSLAVRNATTDGRHGLSDPPREEQLSVCGRAARFHPASWSRQQRYRACPDLESSKKKRALVLFGDKAFGRTGNQIRSFLNAVQYSRDKGIRLGVTVDSWALRTLHEYFFLDGGDDDVDAWKSRMEESLCLRILDGKRPKRGMWVPNWKTSNPKKLFYYQTDAPQEEYVASQMQVLRTLFRHVNTGAGADGTAGRDMCSGIDALFAGDATAGGAGNAVEDPRGAAAYSVVHLRSLEGSGGARLAKTAKKTGCDPVAAQEMRPEYVKSILSPLGLLGHPVVVITDNEKGSQAPLRRLQADPELGPWITLVPPDSRWMGGDMTLAVMVSASRGKRDARVACPVAHLSLREKTRAVVGSHDATSRRTRSSGILPAPCRNSSAGSATPWGWGTTTSTSPGTRAASGSACTGSWGRRGRSTTASGEPRGERERRGGRAPRAGSVVRRRTPEGPPPDGATLRRAPRVNVCARTRKLCCCSQATAAQVTKVAPSKITCVLMDFWSQPSRRWKIHAENLA